MIGRWLSVDPGDTSGWALWEGVELVEGGQTPNWTFVQDVREGLGVAVIDDAGYGGYANAAQGPFERIELLVVEDFLLYPWVIKEGGLDFDPVETARVIGALYELARIADIPFVLQGATIKDAAIAGGAEELFREPTHENRHQNDAIMHGTVYIQGTLLNPENAHVERGRLVPNE